jgi:hypothetical protein
MIRVSLAERSLGFGFCFVFFNGEIFITSAQTDRQTEKETRGGLAIETESGRE